MTKKSKKYQITIHSSPDQAAEEQAKYSAAQNPAERIRETVQLILRIYSSSPKKTNTNHIYFDKE
jgi:hypothetical protein